MNFTLPSFKSLVIDFVGMFTIFIVFSLIVHGAPQLIGNALGAAFWVLVFGVRDSLEPKPQRVFNLVIFGGVEVVVILGFIFNTPTVSNLTIEVLLGLYCAYRFYGAYKTKT